MADVTANLPRRVKVGSYTYVVRLVAATHKDLKADDGTPCWGVTDKEVNTITLAKGMSQERLANTLWHELMHAIYETWGIKDGAREEPVCSTSANGWMQVMVDNPRLELWFHRTWQALRKAR